MVGRTVSGRTLVVLVAMALLVQISPMAMAAKGNPNPGVSPINAKAHGKSYEDWSVRWWQWALGMPVSGHPLFDTTGADLSLIHI